jgi:hypothetical protein
MNDLPPARVSRKTRRLRGDRPRSEYDRLYRATSPLLRSELAQSTAGRMPNATARTVSSQRRKGRSSYRAVGHPTKAVQEMRFVIDQNDDGQFHWRFTGDDGADPMLVSATSVLG